MSAAAPLAPGHPDTISCQTPITVEQIVDQEADTFTVVLHVDARHVLPGLIRALSGHAADMLTIRTKPVADMTWHDAITRIAGDPRRPRCPRHQPRPPLEAVMLVALWALSILAAIVLVGTDPEKGADS